MAWSYCSSGNGHSTRDCHT